MYILINHLAHEVHLFGTNDHFFHINVRTLECIEINLLNEEKNASQKYNK